MRQDIEDLVSLGRRIRVCPYYASRDMSEQAQIVFSPYNYLIDPRVRQSMKIPINDNIIILDEAHNIEDSARESAGGSWSQEDFHLALNDCEKVNNSFQKTEKGALVSEGGIHFLLFLLVNEITRTAKV